MFKMVILLTADNGLAVQFADFYKCLVLCYNAFLLNCRFSFFFAIYSTFKMSLEDMYSGSAE